MRNSQLRLLDQLMQGPKTTRQIVEHGPVSRASLPLLTLDQVHAAMRRMEDNEWVRRVGARPAKWELTENGREAIEAAISVTV